MTNSASNRYKIVWNIMFKLIINQWHNNPLLFISFLQILLLAKSYLLITVLIKIHIFFSQNQYLKQAALVMNGSHRVAISANIWIEASNLWENNTRCRMTWHCLCCLCMLYLCLCMFCVCLCPERCVALLQLA